MHNEKLEWPIRKSTKVECKKKCIFLKRFYIFIHSFIFIYLFFYFFYLFIYYLPIYLFILISNIQNKNSV